MRSSTGKHFIGLDHVRAVAAFAVVVWHFTHGRNGHPIPFDYCPAIFPLAILDEGHTGVAIFIALSGYLFAKLLDGKEIDYKAFLWNRCIRLLPLLILVVIAVGYQKYRLGEGVLPYSKLMLAGFFLPTLPNGAWSITVEFHFYILLPLFLWMFRRSRALPFLVVAGAVALRVYLHYTYGTVQYLAYRTLVGRIDQFALGMILFHYRSFFVGRHILAALTFISFSIFYWYFDRLGGYFRDPSEASMSRLWIVIPTVEALAYSVLICWYDSSFSPSGRGLSRFIGKIGEYSYSIYLLHIFVVFAAADFVNRSIINLSNFYVALLWSAVFFLLMVIPGYLSFKYIEEPFLKLRKRYVISRAKGDGGEDADDRYPQLTARGPGKALLCVSPPAR